MTAPDGSDRVLLQLERGYVLLWPQDARSLAALLYEVADETEGLAEREGRTP